MTPIEDLDISNRPYFALKRAGVVDVEDVAAMTVDEVARIPGVGSASLAEIEYGLIAMNMHFRDAESKPIPSRQIVRPQQWLSIYSEKFPGLWGHLSTLRATRGHKGGIDWPDWCYVPLGGVQAALTALVKRHSLKVQSGIAYEAGIAGIIGTWRVSKGVYRIHPTTMDSLWDTPITDDLPDSVFESMPEWCIYVEVGRDLPGVGWITGFWACLEYDVNTKQRELRLLLDSDSQLVSIPVHLTGNIRDGILAMMRQGITNAGAVLREDGEEFKAKMATFVEAMGRLISPLIYICVSNAQQPEPRKPTNPRRHKRTNNEMAAEEVSIYQIGYRIGRAIRGALAEEAQHREGGGGGPHGEVRPHVRRAHWHTVLSGPRRNEQGQELEPEQRKREVRWFPPIAVKMDQPEQMTPLVRPVR